MCTVMNTLFIDLFLYNYNGVTWINVRNGNKTTNAFEFAFLSSVFLFLVWPPRRMDNISLHLDIMVYFHNILIHTYFSYGWSSTPQFLYSHVFHYCSDLFPASERFGALYFFTHFLFLTIQFFPIKTMHLLTTFYIHNFLHVRNQREEH